MAGENVKVSIIMPAYNTERTIMDSIQSVQAQTYADWELIIVDDASADGTARIIKEAAKIEPRIVAIINKKNSGVSATRNEGIKQAKGEWLAFLDSDDLWLPQKLELQLQFITNIESKNAGKLGGKNINNNVAISYTASSYINANGQPYSYSLSAEEEFSYQSLLRRNLLSCSSVMVKRSAMLAFPQGFIHEDYAVWLNIVKNHGPAYGLNQPLLRYRMAKGTKSSKRFSSAVMTYNSYRFHGLGAVNATLYTIRYAVHSISKRLKIKYGKG